MSVQQCGWVGAAMWVGGCSNVGGWCSNVGGSGCDVVALWSRTWVRRSSYSRFRFKSGVEVEAETDLMTAGVQILAFQQSRHRKLDSGPESMGKGKSNLRVIVDFRCDGRIIVDGVFGSEGEAGGSGAFGPGQLNARAKSRRNLLKERSGEVGGVVETEIDFKVSS